MFNLSAEIKDDRITNNEVMKGLMKLSYDYGTKLIPITFGENIDGCVDLLSVNMKNGKPLWYEIMNFYCDLLDIDVDYKCIPFVKSVIFDYLLRTNLCYMEDRKVVENKSQSFKTSAVGDKFLASKNAQIIGKLIGVSATNCQKLYEKNLDIDLDEMCIGEIPYLKLTRDINKPLIKCNKNLDVTTCSIMSLQLMSYWFQGVCTVLKNNMVEFTYLKDDGFERKLVSTLDFTQMRKYYTDERVREVFELTINSINTDDCFNMPFKGKLERGWILLPEVGASIVEDNGTRAINFNRIKGAKIVTDVDTSFINVSLVNVAESFTKEFNNIVAQQDVKSIVKIYSELQKCGYREDFKYPVNYFTNVGDIATLIRSFISNKKFAGTQFKKDLHTFMVKNPDIFPNYIGEKVSVKETKNYGIDFTDF